MSAKSVETVENGTEIFIPLNKLKKSPKNARKTPHSEAAIEALCGEHRRQRHPAKPCRRTGV
jgi:hypothetical protein